MVQKAPQAGVFPQHKNSLVAIHALVLPERHEGGAQVSLGELWRPPFWLSRPGKTIEGNEMSVMGTLQLPHDSLYYLGHSPSEVWTQIHSPIDRFGFHTDYDGTRLAT